jgi:transposase
VKLMTPNYVKAYLKRSKSDANDAAAICEAVTQPSMRFVAIKTKEQQAALMLHRARQLLVRQRTMLSNALRAHLAELGIVSAKGQNAAPTFSHGAPQRRGEPLLRLGIMERLSSIGELAHTGPRLVGRASTDPCPRRRGDRIVLGAFPGFHQIQNRPHWSDLAGIPPVSVGVIARGIFLP